MYTCMYIVTKQLEFFCPLFASVHSAFTNYKASTCTIHVHVHIHVHTSTVQYNYMYMYIYVWVNIIYLHTCTYMYTAQVLTRHSSAGGIRYVIV